MNNWKNADNKYAPITLANGWTVEVDAPACIGAGPCTAFAPNTFQIDEHGKAGLLDSANLDTVEAIMEAAQSCPLMAITIKDATGKVLYPEM